jgi:hypothetical protein
MVDLFVPEQLRWGNAGYRELLRGEGAFVLTPSIWALLYDHVIIAGQIRLKFGIFCCV